MAVTLGTLALIFGTLPFLLGFMAYMTPRLTSNRMLIFKAESKSGSRMVEHFRNHETIKAISGESRTRRFGPSDILIVMLYEDGDASPAAPGGSTGQNRRQ